jgi:hypothetical protein
MSLTDSQIIDLCGRMSIPLGDVCFKDELPDNLDFNKGYFINLQDSVDQDGKPSPGTHWTFVECIKYPNDKTDAIYFDPYGVAPPENVKRVVKNTIGREGVPHTTKDIQSLMNNACGYYCLAFAHYINASRFRSCHLFTDVETFMSLFEDLNKSTDFKKNEYILHMFFRSEAPELRKEIDVFRDDEHGEIDGFKLPVDVKIMK